MNDKERDNLLVKILEKLNELDNKIEKQAQAIERLNSKIEELRLNMVNMEFNLTDKIEALFDAREVTLDKFEHQDKELVLVNRMLDRHERRISNLEKIG